MPSYIILYAIWVRNGDGREMDELSWEPCPSGKDLEDKEDMSQPALSCRTLCWVTRVPPLLLINSERHFIYQNPFHIN